MKKYCYKCQEIKSLRNFSKDSSRTDGYTNSCKLCRQKMDKIYYRKHTDERALYYQNNKETILKKKTVFYKKHQKRLLKEATAYNKTHRGEKTTYMRNKRKMDIRFRLGCLARTRIWYALMGNKKSLSTMFLIGCEIDYLMYYLQCKFKKGMTWDNYGRNGWVVDHIKPCASFDLSKPEEQQKCFHYTNLQPLWAKENHKKLSKDIKQIRKYKNDLCN